MPIKFRCNHCRQLLGISRAKAAQVVDCPTCGRSVRVPDLDGRRDPLPAPQLDLADSRLAGALDQLAQIGQEADSDRTAAPAAPRGYPASPKPPEIIQPQPMSDPVPIEPPQPIAAASTPAGGSSGARSAKGSPPVPAAAAPPGESPGANSALAELARGAAQTPPAPMPATGSRRSRSSSFFGLTATLMMLGGVCLGFAAGYLVGHGRGGGSSNNGANGAADGGGRGDHPAANGTAMSSTKPAVKGRVTYKNEDGDSRPDRKARVFVFPQQREGERTLDITGFRGGDSAGDFRSAAAAFRALGGDVVLVDDEGAFEISLPAAGTYHILVVSNYQPRDTDEAIDESLLNLLAKYFDRPEQLLGSVAYHFGQVRYKGSKPVLWDHSF